MLGTGVAPTAAERALLGRRRAALEAALAHRDPRALVMAVTEMLVALKTRTADESDAAATVAVYAELLDGSPAWAVVEACRRAAIGQGPSRTFAPTAAELLAMVAAILAPHYAERADLDAILTASPPRSPPDEAAKARVAAMIAGFRRGGAAAGVTTAR